MKKKTEYRLHMILGPLGILLLLMALGFLITAICVSLVHVFSGMTP